MYTLIQSGYANMMELCEYYTLDEALKLYAMYRMKTDIEGAKMDEIGKEVKR